MNRSSQSRLSEGDSRRRRLGHPQRASAGFEAVRPRACFPALGCRMGRVPWASRSSATLISTMAQPATAYATRRRFSTDEPLPTRWSAVEEAGPPSWPGTAPVCCRKVLENVLHLMQVRHKTRRCNWPRRLRQRPAASEPLVNVDHFLHTQYISAPRRIVTWNLPAGFLYQTGI